MKKIIKVFGVKNMVLREGEVEKTKGQTRDARESEKFWKTAWFLTIFFQNMCFLRLNWLTNELPSELLKTLKPKFWKKILSLFEKSIFLKILKIFVSLFHDWDLHSPNSRKCLDLSSWLEHDSQVSRENAKL